MYLFDDQTKSSPSTQILDTWWHNLNNNVFYM